MPSGRPTKTRPTYCPTCDCDTLQPPDIGCVVCAARAAKPGGLRLRADVEPTFDLTSEQNASRIEILIRHMKAKRAIDSGHAMGVAPLVINAIRRDRRRRIFPKRV